MSLHLSLEFLFHLCCDSLLVITLQTHMNAVDCCYDSGYDSVICVILQGVMEFSLCLLFAKLVSYTFLYWLPLYIANVGTYSV